MTDQAVCMYQARQWAAARYRAGGYNDFAIRVENGLEDECSCVRLGRFFFEPPEQTGPAFIGAWNEFASLMTASKS